jgi:ABC-type transport system involved in multi-copper enzyme maturation permease subunit
MIKTLAIKELREIRGLSVVALILFLIWLSVQTGIEALGSYWQAGNEVPFASDRAIILFAYVSGLFAVALGFRQSAWENGQGTYLLLLHRPIRRPIIFLTKILVGLSAYALCSLAPLVIYIWWAATPGHSPTPFAWSMTGLAWQIWYVLGLVYLGAFLSGIRPARWFGTRLLPFFTAVVSATFLIVFPLWWPIGFPLSIVCYALFLANIWHVVDMRDYG